MIYGLSLTLGFTNDSQVVEPILIRVVYCYTKLFIHFPLTNLYLGQNIFSLIDSDID